MRIYRFWFACFCLVFSFIISGQVHATETAALISDVSGNATIKINGASSPAKLLASIPVGTKIELAAGAKLSLIYVAKGEEYKLTGPGSYQLEGASPHTISGAEPAKQASIGGALNGKRIRSENVTQATLTMRGVKKVHRNLEPLTPSGSITLADPLQLRWRAPTDGLAYQIQLIDNQNKALVAKEVTGNTFTLPPEIQLASGGYYVWNVTTTLPDGSLVNASAQFKVASNEIREQAAKLKPGKNGTVSERVAYGLWLEGENLSNEAVQVWVELAEDYPDEPNIRERANLKP
jgi:hypothetical protein